jgi:hypothetical protein
MGFSSLKCRKQAWLLKKCGQRNVFSVARASVEFFFRQVPLSGGWQNRPCRLAEEPH